jgi:hypothetical protein
MRYRLRTLLMLLAIVPLLIWGGYWAWSRYSKPNVGVGVDPATNTYVREEH